MHTDHLLAHSDCHYCKQVLPYSGILLQEEIFANHMDFLRRYICNFWLLYPQQEIHIRYMDPKMCASFNFC